MQTVDFSVRHDRHPVPRSIAVAATFDCQGYAFLRKLTNLGLRILAMSSGSSCLSIGIVAIVVWHKDLPRRKDPLRPCQL